MEWLERKGVRCEYKELEGLGHQIGEFGYSKCGSVVVEFLEKEMGGK